MRKPFTVDYLVAVANYADALRKLNAVISAEIGDGANHMRFGADSFQDFMDEIHDSNRSLGYCPNGCAALVRKDDGYRCPKCGFGCNALYAIV